MNTGDQSQSKGSVALDVQNSVPNQSQLALNTDLATFIGSLKQPNQIQLNDFGKNNGQVDLHKQSLMMGRSTVQMKAPLPLQLSHRSRDDSSSVVSRPMSAQNQSIQPKHSNSASSDTQRLPSFRMTPTNHLLFQSGISHQPMQPQPYPGMLGAIDASNHRQSPKSLRSGDWLSAQLERPGLARQDKG